MKLIVTGVCGFIGSNLLKALLKEGHNVVGIDNLSYGSIENIAPFTKDENFQFIQADLCEKGILDQTKADVIIHLASFKIPRYTNAFQTLEENNKMLKVVIEKCIKDDSKLVFSSTSDIYGKNPDLPYHEESNSVLGPTTVKRWAYALSKLYAEQYIIANHAECNLKYTIMRFFGSYGPNQNTTWWGGPQSAFIQNILEGKNIEVHGDGLQTRTFTYIDDTIQGILKCIFNPKALNEIFNIANDASEEITIIDLAKTICKLMPESSKSIEIEMVPYQKFGKYEDVLRRVPDIKKIKTMLGFEPKYTLQEGLKRTIEWQVKKHSVIA